MQQVNFQVYDILRWLLVPVAGFVGWFLAFLLGILTLSIVEALVADLLNNNGAPATYRILLTSFTGLSGMLVVMFPALVAPQQKGGIAVLAYLIGATYFILLDASLWPPYLAAILAGLVAMLFAVKRWSVPDL